MASTQADIDISALAKDLAGVEGLFDRRDERVTLALYRLLAEGEPVSRERLAAATPRSLSEITDWLRGAWVDLDQHGEVVAFHGLSLRPTPHVLVMDGRTLYAWCAADALGLSALLRRPTRIRSTDPITGEAVSLSLEDGRIREAEPSTAVLSMMRPDDISSMLAPEGTSPDDVIRSVCGPINFFGSEETGRALTERVKATFLLTIEEAVELGRLMNEAAFGSVLAGDAC